MVDYHRRSIRLRKYDYASSGMYFVTMCTQDREELLGEIVDGKIILNNIGNIIDDFWKILSLKYDGFDVDTWVIMPNHIHVIIKIVGANPPCSPD